MNLRESAVARQVRELAAWSGYEVHRLHAGKYRTMDGRRVITMAPTGTPDMLLVHPSKPPLYVETKSSRGTATQMQRLTHESLRQRGFRVCVVANWKQVKAIFEGKP